MSQNIPSGSSVHSLYDIADYINGRATRPSEIEAEGVPVIKIAELHGGITDRTDRISLHRVQDKHWVRDGDLLFAWSGSVGVHVYHGPNAALNQHIFRVVAREHIDQRFLRYLLVAHMDIFRALVDDKRTTMGHVTIRDLKATDVSIPPLKHQRKVAKILSVLDDKADVNRRMNHSIEELTTALFKSWFIDFRPVRAKASGRWRTGESLPGLPNAIHGLFPDRLVPSELGLIPDGWKVRQIGSDFCITMGQSPPGTTYNHEGHGLPFYQGRADFTYRFPRQRVFCTAGTRFANSGDSLVSVRAPVGDLNLAYEKCVIGRGVAAVRHNSGSSPYTYYFMQHLRPRLETFENEGTVFGAINKRDFNGMLHAVPPNDLIKRFHTLAKDMDHQVKTGEWESRSLIAMRDTLMTRLMTT